MEDVIIITDNNEVVITPDFNSIISNYIKSGMGRQSLAQAMIAPIHRNLDYQGLARKMFSVQPMPQGAQVFYHPSGIEDKEDKE